MATYPTQANEVFEWLRRAELTDPSMAVLRSKTPEIAERIAAEGGFVLVEDKWVLPDRVMQDWILAHADEYKPKPVTQETLPLWKRLTRRH